MRNNAILENQRGTRIPRRTSNIKIADGGRPSLSEYRIFRTHTAVLSPRWDPAFIASKLIQRKRDS